MISENMVGYKPFRLAANGAVKTSGGYLKSCAIGLTDGAAAWTFKILDDAVAEHVSNGAFTGNATGWDLTSPWAYGADKVSIDGSQLVATAFSQTITTLVPGKSYVLTYTTTRTAGGVTPSLGGTAGTAQNTAATFTETIVCGSSTSTLSFEGNPTFAGSVDTVTLQALPCYELSSAVAATNAPDGGAVVIPVGFGFQIGCYFVVTNTAFISGSYL